MDEISHFSDRCPTLKETMLSFTVRESLIASNFDIRAAYELLKLRAAPGFSVDDARTTDLYNMLLECQEGMDKGITQDQELREIGDTFKIGAVLG